MKQLLSTVVVVFCALRGALAGAGEPMPLWPNGAPDETGAIGAEHDTTKTNNNLIAGRPIIRLTNVKTPAITVYSPPSDKNSGAAVVVCPGGGYSILAMDLEGTEVCQWFNSIGVTGVLLKYRVPRRTGDTNHLLPLEDVQRALGLVRFHAKDWGIDPKRVGVLGFSAGGHLAAHLSTSFDPRAYARVDEADDLSCRPDFALLIYPGGVAKSGSAVDLSPGLNVSSNAPPTFLVQAEDDPVRCENCIAYFLALKRVKVPAEMHLYPVGGHGYGLRPSDKAVATWPRRAEEWMAEIGALPAAGH